MYKHWGLHISTNINHLSAVLGSFWAIWRGLLWCLKAKHRSWQFLRYWWFNKQYYSGYQLICLISWPLLITLRHDWYRLKGLFKGFRVPLRLWELSKNWWRYGWMKSVTYLYSSFEQIFCYTSMILFSSHFLWHYVCKTEHGMMAADSELTKQLSSHTLLKNSIKFK